MSKVKIPYKLLPKQLDGLTINQIHSDHMPQIANIPIVDVDNLGSGNKPHIKAVIYNIANSTGPILFQPPDNAEACIRREPENEKTRNGRIVRSLHSIDQRNDPDVITLQEALPADEDLQKSFLASLEATFPSWGLLIVDDPTSGKKPNITLYRLDRLEVKKTPEVDWSACNLEESVQAELENSVQTTTFYHRQSKKLINIHNVHLAYSEGKADLAEAVVKALFTQYTNAQNIMLGDFNAWIPPTDFDLHHNGTNTTPPLAADEYYCCDSFFTARNGKIEQIPGKVINPESGNALERPSVLEAVATASKPYTQPMFEGNHWLPLSIPRTFDDVAKNIERTLKGSDEPAEPLNLSIHLQKNLYNDASIKIAANTNIPLLDELRVHVEIYQPPKNSKKKQNPQSSHTYFLYPNTAKDKCIIELLYWLNGVSIAKAITNATTNIKTLPYYNLFSDSLNNIAQLAMQTPSNETAMVLALTENLLNNCSEKNIRAYLEFALEVSGKPSRNAQILGASMLCLGVLVTAAAIVFATLPVTLVLPIVFLGVVALLASSIGVGSLYAGRQKDLSKEMHTIGTRLLADLSFFPPKSDKSNDQPQNTFNPENTGPAQSKKN